MPIESPADVDEVIAAADTAFLAHDHQRVIDLLLPVRDSPHLDPTKVPSIVWQLGRASFMLGNYADSREYLEEVRGLGDSDLATAASEFLAKIEKEMQGVGDITDGVVEGTTEIQRVLDAGDSALAAQRFEDALELFTQAYQSDDLWLDGAARAGLGLAQALAGLGRWSEAKEYTDYLRTNAFGTPSAEGVDRLADVVDREVAAQQAASDGVAGGEVASLLLAAQSAFDSLDYQGACDLYWQVHNTAMIDGQTRADCAYWIGECSFQQHQYDAARAWFEEAANASNLGRASEARTRLQELDRLDRGTDTAGG
jgi:tetratricopeptide (TPR) repeat protein